jgi:hypothetical protein
MSNALNEKLLEWLPYSLTADLEVDMQTVFSRDEIQLVMAGITASAVANLVEEKCEQMRKTAAFFQSLTKEVLFRRCERLQLLGKVLKNIRDRNNNSR